MSIPPMTLLVQQGRVRAAFRTRYPGKPLGPRRFLGATANAVAMSMLGLHKAIEEVDRDAIPSPDSSLDALKRFAHRIGLPSNAGGYGANVATLATGGEAALTGTKGTAFANGAVASSEDGATQIALSGAVTISGSPPGPGTVTGTFVAVTPGTAGNLPAGTRCTWQSAPAGADTVFTLSSGLGGALDEESKDDLYARILDHLQRPRNGGTAADYRDWAGTADGVFQVFVYPLRGGLGTVHLVVVAAGSGTGRVPSGDVLTAVGDYLATVRPVTVNGLRVLQPYMPGANARAVRIRVEPTAKFAFDWNDTAGYLVGTYSPGTGAGGSDQIVLTTDAPQDLQLAISSGGRPRLQVIATGGPVVPVQVRATVYTQVAGPAAKLDLDNPLPAGWVPPTAGDAVYAGGPVVQPLAELVLAHVDEDLGPSRASGYGDTVAPWDDTLRIARLIDLAMEAKDADDTKLLRNILSSAGVPAVTIDGATADVQPSDITINGPELLFLGSVAITQ